MVRIRFIALVWLIVAITSSTTSLNGQGLKPPNIPNKPPTADDIKREAEKARKKAEKARHDFEKLCPAGVAEEAWGEAGRRLYPEAARVMSKRSPTGEQIDRDMKDQLRPKFGELVNKVTLHWGTPPLDEWADPRFGIRLSSSDTEAQTYGYNIYIRYRKGQKDVDVLRILSHEMMHVKQFERYDKSLSNFGYHYFKEYKKANENYAKNKLEKEAVAADLPANSSADRPQALNECRRGDPPAYE
jgi:hypothetical protein